MLPSPMQVGSNDDATVTLDGRAYSLIRELGRGKSAISYLYGCDGELVTVKRYIEVAHNGIPFEQALEVELLSYQRMCQAGVRCPELLGYCTEQYLLVKRFVPGEVISDRVAAGTLTDAIFAKAFAYANQLKQHGFHVDFFPANFVLSDDELYCIDYEAHPYMEEWNFPNWGIFYWLNQQGLRQFLQDGQHHHINKPDSFKPWDEPFVPRRDELMAAFG